MRLPVPVAQPRWLLRPVLCEGGDLTAWCLQGRSVWYLSEASDDTPRKPTNQGQGARAEHMKSSIRVLGSNACVPVAGGVPWQRGDLLILGVHWKLRTGYQKSCLPQVSGLCGRGWGGRKQSRKKQAHPDWRAAEPKL